MEKEIRMGVRLGSGGKVGMESLHTRAYVVSRVRGMEGER